MATKTYGKHDIVIEDTIVQEPFIYESIVRHQTSDVYPGILAYSVAMDPGVTRLVAITRDQDEIEVLFGEPFTNGKEWIYVDSLGSPTNYAQRSGTIIRNGTRILPVSVSGIGGIGVSSNLQKLFFLDAHGRRFYSDTIRTRFELEKVWIDVLRVSK